MKIFGIGDVIGKPGRKLLHQLLREFVAQQKIDLVVANAENSAGGLGTNRETADDLLAAGVGVLTGGNHTWKHREYSAYLDRSTRAVRPYNYPNGAPGRGYTIVPVGEYQVAVLNLIGRTYMDPVDNPFVAADTALAEITAITPIIVVDMHAEASSEKRAMGWHLDGRVSVVWGTHTHVPTADEEILPRGTAYLSDIGMTGAYASVIGLDPEPSVTRFRTGLPTGYRLAEGNLQLRGVLVEVDVKTGRAQHIERVTLRGPTQSK